MDSKYGKKGMDLLVAGLGIAWLVAFLLSAGSAPPVSNKVAVVVTSKKTAQVKPIRIVPVVQPVDLLVTFPKPTINTIVVAKAPQYVKISHADSEFLESANDGDCVEDKSTGLIWEKKTQNRGLRDAGNFYSWYNPKDLSNGGHAGVADNGKCRGGINCDTDAYVKAINELKLCGFSDWRLPTRAELMSLVQYSGQKKGKGLIDRRYFPTATSDWYWAADSDDLNPSRAWYVLFFNGRYMKAPKSMAKRIRLVRTRSERSIRNMAQKTTTVATKPEALVASKPAVKPSPSDS